MLREVNWRVAASSISLDVSSQAVGAVQASGFFAGRLQILELGGGVAANSAPEALGVLLSLPALYERKILEQGRTGLGFGVGHEPLPALFASRGCTIVATDQAPDDAIKGGWQGTGQHADGLAALERPEICAPRPFRERVSFEVVDMNDIPAHLRDRFDFCWSACCLEHLGSLAHGLRFIENSLNTLKIGGTAVHTTEFNLSSDVATLESRDLSIYRRSDIEAVVKRLEQAGHHVEPLDFSRGNTLARWLRRSSALSQ